MHLKQSTFSLASSQRLTSTCLQPRPCMEMISTHKGHWKSQQELWEVFVCPHCLPLLFESNEEVRRIRVSSNATNKTEKDKRPQKLCWPPASELERVWKTVNCYLCTRKRNKTAQKSRFFWLFGFIFFLCIPSCLLMLKLSINKHKS